MAAARQVEQEFGLAALEFDPTAIEGLETFPIIEKALLRHAENRLLEKADLSACDHAQAGGEILRLSESRLSRFWCDVEPRPQARWALVAPVAEVLLEADRVEQAFKRAPASVTGMIKEYVEGTEP